MIQIKKIMQNFFALILFFNFTNIFATIDYLDTTFGINANGIVTQVLGTSAKINSIRTDANGNFIVTGFAVVNNVQNLVVARFNSSGILDNTFGTNGVAYVTEGTSATGNGIEIDSSNNIVVVGAAIVSGVNNIFITRLTSTGSLDLSFGTAGKVTKLVGTSVVGNGLVLDANGKIVLVATSVSGGKNNLTVARYNTNGTIDTTFGSSGVKSLVNGNGYSGNSIKIDSSARIVVGGLATISTGSNLLLVRLTVAGATDSTFGSSGVVTTAVSGNTTSGIQSIELDSSGHIVAGGFAGSSTVSNFLVARYTSTGTLDTSFGTSSNGIQITTIGTNSEINRVKIDANNKIVVSGLSDTFFAVARYNVNGSLDTTFALSGILTTSICNSAQANSLHIQTSDNRAVAAGFTINSGQPEFALVRYNKNNTDFVNITSLVDNSTINTKIPAIAGTASAGNASVQVIVNGNLFTTVSTDASGNWDAGQTNVLPIGQNVIQVNLIVSSVVVVAHVAKFTVVDTTGEDSLFAYGTNAQTTTNAAYQAVPFNQIPKLGTWSYSNANSAFTCNKSGTYLVQYSGQAGATGTIGSGTSYINISATLDVNNIEYLGSESNTTLDLLPNYTSVLSGSLIRNFVPGDTVSLDFGVTIQGDNTGFNAGLITNPNSVGNQPCYSLAISRIG